MIMESMQGTLAVFMDLVNKKMQIKEIYMRMNVLIQIGPLESYKDN